MTSKKKLYNKRKIEDIQEQPPIIINKDATHYYTQNKHTQKKTHIIKNNDNNNNNIIPVEKNDDKINKEQNRSNGFSSLYIHEKFKYNEPPEIIRRVLPKLLPNIPIYLKNNLPHIPKPIKPNPYLDVIFCKNDELFVLYKLMIISPYSFSDDTKKDIEDAIRKNSDSITLIFLVYINKDIKHILSVVVTFINNKLVI